MKYLFALWVFLCFFNFFSYLDVQKNEKKHNSSLKYSEGSYILELVSNKQGVLNFFIMGIYEDPIYGAAKCHTDRKNFIRKSSYLLEKHNLKITCTRYHKYRV